MGRRIGRRKAAAGGAAVAVVAVIGLLLLSDGGVPFIAGRPAATASPDPVDLPPYPPLADFDGYVVRSSHVDLEGDGVGAPASALAAITADDLDDLDGLDGPDGVGDLDRDRGERRPERDGSMLDTEGALASLLLALIVLKAVHDQDRDRRRRATAPDSAPASTSTSASSSAA